MASTIGRTGANVLSPVRHTEKPLPLPEHFNVKAPNDPPPEKKGRESISDSNLVASENDCGLTQIERLPFPTMKESVKGAGALPGAVSFDSSLTQSSATKEAPRTMIYSRSQDLHGTAVKGKWLHADLQHLRSGYFTAIVLVLQRTQTVNPTALDEARAEVPVPAALRVSQAVAVLRTR
jgi:hypothetical protein